MGDSSWFRRRAMIQLSDAPWMIIAALLGLVIEGGLVLVGVNEFVGFWWFIAKVGLLYSAALGYTSFHLTRSVTAFVLGALAGAAFVCLNEYVVRAQTKGLGAGADVVTAFVGSVIVSAVIPYLTDVILHRWFMRGVFRWLASHHPKYAHLGESATE